MKTQFTKWMRMLITVVACGLLAACSGGGADPDPAVVEPGVLTGTLDVTGTLLADLADPAVTGDLDAGKWSGRVIDPTESVDAITIDHTDMTILPVSLVPHDEYWLEIELLPAVDLTGGDSDTTPLLLDIAVPIESLVTTSAAISVEIVAPAAAVSTRLTAQATGYTVRLTYALNGPRQENALIEMDWANQQLRRDSNANGSLDDEVFFADTDRNGISDNRQQAGPGNGDAPGPTPGSDGVIEALDLAAGRITVDGVVYVIDETTSITVEDGTALTPASLAVGLPAEVEGHKGKFGMLYAREIQLTLP